MASKKNETGTAKATDYRREVDGLANPQFEKELVVDYSYEYDVLESDEELHKEFSPKDLLNLANARLKSTANSGARQKAIGIYAMSGDDAARDEMIKAAMKLNKKLTKEQAEAYVDGLQTIA